MYTSNLLQICYLILAVTLNTMLVKMFDELDVTWCKCGFVKICEVSRCLDQCTKCIWSIHSSMLPNRRSDFKAIWRLKMISLASWLNRILWIHPWSEWYRFLVPIPLQWRHSEREGLSNHRRLECLFNCLFRRRLKETSKLRVTGLCEGNPPVTGGFLSQRVGNAKNVSIWWRHHDLHILEHVIFRSRPLLYFRYQLQISKIKNCLFDIRIKIFILFVIEYFYHLK